MHINQLVSAFAAAKAHGERFIGLKIKMDGFEKEEIIINERENFDSKLTYYENTYDEGLIHKYSRGISIVDVSSGNSFDEIQADLID